MTQLSTFGKIYNNIDGSLLREIVAGIKTSNGIKYKLLLIIDRTLNLLP